MALDYSTYRPAGTSAFDRLNTPTECGHCLRSGLKTTVKMASPDGAVVWMGTGCAAKALGLPAKEFNALRRVADETVRKAEETTRRAAAELEDAAWSAFLLSSAGPGDRIDQIRRLGGFAAAKALYRKDA